MSKENNSGNQSLSGIKAKLNGYLAKVQGQANDSLQKTIAVAVGVSLFCAVFVSFSAVALRPLQQANKELDIKKNIVTVAGLMNESTDIEAAFSNVEIKLVDLETGEYSDAVDIATFDARKASADPALGITIDKQDDVAHIKRRAKYAKVYLVRKAGALDAIILPVSGYGLWSTMYGFLALEADAQTVRGINFYDQAETPGLGGEVVNPVWREIWHGKKVYNEQGEPMLGLIKGSVDPSRPGAEFQVDGLAGATLTSQGVSNLIKYWMGQNGFGPFINKVKTLEGAA